MDKPRPHIPEWSDRGADIADIEERSDPPMPREYREDYTGTGTYVAIAPSPDTPSWVRETLTGPTEEVEASTRVNEYIAGTPEVRAPRPFPLDGTEKPGEVYAFSLPPQLPAAWMRKRIEEIRNRSK